MANRLIPPEGQPALAPREIVRRAQSEFNYVGVDEEAGRDHVSDMIATFLQLSAPSEIIDFHVRVQSGAIELTIGDGDDFDHFLHTVAIPEGDLFIGYSSAQHQEAIDPLVARLARVLGYDRIKL